MELYTETPYLEYFDTNANMTYDEMLEKVTHSTTLYVGNLGPSVTDKELNYLFGEYGDLTRIIMGVNHRNEYCGFCFVEYKTREDADYAKRALDKTQVDGKFIRVDWDYGYKEGREFGRGKDGEQKQSQRRFERRRFDDYRDRGERRDWERRERMDDYRDDRNYLRDDKAERRRTRDDDEGYLPARGPRRFN
ncbi:nuclear cap-binding protein subunit, putative [Entamoeba invadens IP1]|uniref:Nuclear cap-binding protein subunit 2 n=1 Tax=Entamoeba invadens IP1 TaxID=370355 RepID=A0A0A1TXN8_ENTIV|nr:nuclear cap-binding protein subunit, putative [Entamoeba invadens IP1]ELP86129.1 nuclear cap-binding protein subunit, putative [Entamoeba invadens IP1]|eukprot:XP_004185475.1 nuclear cap-binding protein subunit, putative [Entamoeba invadens IP1]